MKKKEDIHKGDVGYLFYAREWWDWIFLLQTKKNAIRSFLLEKRNKCRKVKLEKVEKEKNW